MINWRNIAFSSVVLSTVLALAGCSSTTAKPEVSSTAPASPSEESKTQPAPAPAAGISSLEAFQRGESTATPASSPLKEVYFDFDRYDLRADARDTLKANGDWLKANPSVVVEIEGHCDERGTNEYNMALGAKRAQAAMDYLTTLGVAANRLSTISYGEEVPVCEEHTEECWAKNRRDRFIIQPTRPAS
jgi:peptidoglycan-associated lipoprotein